MHVLVAGSIIDASSVGEPRLDLRELLGGEQPGDGEPPRMQRRALDVVGEELRVVRLDELPDRGGELALTRPAQSVKPRTARARAAASSASSEASRMKPSAASCGNVSPVAYEASVSAYSACSERRPLTTAAAARSWTRTSPGTSSWVLSTNASIASRTGENQRPS